MGNKDGMLSRWFGRKEDEKPSDAPEQISEKQDAEDVITEQEQPTPDTPPKKAGLFSRLTKGLSRSSSRLSGGVAAIFTQQRLDDAMLEDLEDLLITADLGVTTASAITAKLASERFDKEITPEEVKTFLAEEVSRTLEPWQQSLALKDTHTPQVILMIGVNGAGKTTTIGKLARKFQEDGKSVLLAAGDTFRAAAIEQLTIWGERNKVPVVAREVGADAAGLAFDAIDQAKKRQYRCGHDRHRRTATEQAGIDG